MNFENFNYFHNNVKVDVISLDRFSFGYKLQHTLNLLEQTKDEISHQLISNNSDKEILLDYLSEKIGMSEFDEEQELHSIKHWLDKFDISIDEILKFSWRETHFGHLINTIHNEIDPDYPDKEFAFSIQKDLYIFFCKYLINDFLEFINIKKDYNKSTANKRDNSKQLTINQSVILLDKLGFFSSDPVEALPNTKVADILSVLLNKNDKNIKTAIEALECKPNSVTPNYQKDLDIVQKLLSKTD